MGSAESSWVSDALVVLPGFQHLGFSVSCWAIECIRWFGLNWFRVGIQTINGIILIGLASMPWLEVSNSRNLVWIATSLFVDSHRGCKASCKVGKRVGDSA